MPEKYIVKNCGNSYVYMVFFGGSLEMDRLQNKYASLFFVLVTCLFRYFYDEYELFINTICKC